MKPRPRGPGRGKARCAPTRAAPLRRRAGGRSLPTTRPRRSRCPRCSGCGQGQTRGCGASPRPVRTAQPHGTTTHHSLQNLAEREKRPGIPDLTSTGSARLPPPPTRAWCRAHGPLPLSRHTPAVSCPLRLRKELRKIHTNVLQCHTPTRRAGKEYSHKTLASAPRETTGALRAPGPAQGPSCKRLPGKGGPGEAQRSTLCPRNTPLGAALKGHEGPQGRPPQPGKASEEQDGFLRPCCLLKGSLSLAAPIVPGGPGSCPGQPTNPGCGDTAGRLSLGFLAQSSGQ